MPNSAFFAGLVAVLIAISSCDWMPAKGQTVNILSLQLPDSLTAFDTVLVRLLNPAGAETLETLWNGPLKSVEDLNRLELNRYPGSGPMVILVEGFKTGVVGYRMLIRYKGPDGKPVIMGPDPMDVPDPIGRPDTVKPVITLYGSDTMALVSIASFRNPGGECEDERDGDLVLQEGQVSLESIPESGYFRIVYTCEDFSGNRSEAARVFKIGMYTGYLAAQREAAIDTLDQARNPNHGYTGVLSFALYPSDSYMSFVKFDLSRIEKEGLKSARLYFYAFPSGKGWTSGLKKLRFHPYLLRSPWSEGTGNWYWHDTFWQNGGTALYQGYGLSDSVSAKSTNPLYPDGVSPEDKALVRDENLTILPAQIVNAFFPRIPPPGSVPPPMDLTVVELDVTAYVLSADASNDHGFLIKVEGLARGEGLGFLTKEIGDGSYAPKMMLTY